MAGHSARGRDARTAEESPVLTAEAECGDVMAEAVTDSQPILHSLHRRLERYDRRRIPTVVGLQQAQQKRIPAIAHIANRPASISFHVRTPAGKRLARRRLRLTVVVLLSDGI